MGAPDGIDVDPADGVSVIAAVGEPVWKSIGGGDGSGVDPCGCRSEGVDDG